MPNTPDSPSTTTTRTGDYESPFVIAVDVGSSSVKAAIYDAKGRAVPGTESRSGHPLHSSADGASVEYADHLIEHVEAVMDGIMSTAADFSIPIAAVGMDGMASTVLGVDRLGQAVTPIYTYADTRPSKFVDQLTKELDVEATYQRTGTPQHTSYLPARFLWIQATDPDLTRKIHRWMDIGAFLYSRWFDDIDVPMSYSMASWTGLLNRRTLRWDKSLLDHIGVSEKSLQPLASFDHAMRGLAEPFARRWPALRDVPFFLAVGDGAAANVGSGCVSGNSIALTIGTSGAIRIILDKGVQEVPQGLWAYRLGKRHTLLGGAFSDGGSVFAWQNEVLRLPSPAETEKALCSMPPDGHGLTVLPFLSGERSLGWVASARATIHGLSIATSPLEILQASLEAVAYRFAAVHAILKIFASEDYEITANGGAITGSPYWLQLMADALGHSVTVSTEEEATSRGTAVLALYALGVWPTLDHVPAKLGAKYQVKPERAVKYQIGMRRQQELYNLVVRDRTRDVSAAD